MGFASGFRTGYDTVRDMEKRRREEELRKGLQAEAAKYAPTEVASGEEALRTFRENYVPAPGGPTAEEYIAQNLGGLQQRPAGYTVEQALVPELGGRQFTTLAQAEQAVAPSRTAGLANVYREAGEIGKAEELAGLSRRGQLENLQIKQAQRQEDFNTALQDISTKKFEKPEDRTNAVLDVFRTYDPKGAASLEASYSQNELNKITLNAKKFEQDYSQARRKGLDSVLNWYDGVNDGFTLRREGNRIIQTNTDGSQQVFAQGTDDQIMMRMDALAKPGGFLELAKNEADIARAEEQTRLARAQREALPGAAETDALRQNIALADQFRKQIADIDAQLVNYGEGTPQHTALLAQRNAISRSLTDVNRLLQPGGLTRGSGQTGGAKAERARAAALSGKNPATGKAWTKQDIIDYEDEFGPWPGSKPAPAPTQGLVSQPASPRAARAAAARTTQERIPEPPPKKTRGGVTNPEYTKWEKEYGARYRANQQ